MVAITRKRGDTYADEIIVKSAKTKLPVDITGYSFVMTLDPGKAPVDATTNVYSIAGVILDAVAGRVEFAPTLAQADQLGGFYYDVQMTDGAGRKRTIALDKYTYTQDITKA
jgi:hypothetical protein